MRIVVDNGSGRLKGGFEGDDLPRVVFPSMIGRPKEFNRVLTSCGTREEYIGEDARIWRRALVLTYPIRRGVVQDWDDMAKILHHTFTIELHISAGEHAMLLTEPPLNPTANRERMTELLFEKFQVPAMYVGMPAVLALYATGRCLSGCVLDSGEGVTHSVRVFEGRALRHAMTRMDVGGGDLTDYMTTILAERGHFFTTIVDREIVREVKERTTFVAVDGSMPASESTSYELPDGIVVELRDERVRAPEVLFKPWLIGKEAPGIHESLLSTISKCDIDTRRDLYSNVVLSGGNTLFHGLPERLTNELNAQTPSSSWLLQIGKIYHGVAVDVSTNVHLQGRLR
ncbi:Actin, aortic smooth muscle [Aphanomyces cochlioides]|nr:Actin, aortic smooth muscle [Aphanomyces cochlioides]